MTDKIENIFGRKEISKLNKICSARSVTLDVEITYKKCHMYFKITATWEVYIKYHQTWLPCSTDWEGDDFQICCDEAASDLKKRFRY